MLKVRVTRLKCPTCGWQLIVAEYLQRDDSYLKAIWTVHLNRAVKRFKRTGYPPL